MKLPEIRIDFSWLLLNNVSKVLATHFDRKLLTFEEYTEKTEKYRSEWKKYEKDIVVYMQKQLGLRFYKPVLDVSLAPMIQAFSDPLIINFMNEPDEFVDTLTHELIHVLLTDNDKISIKNFEKNVDLRGEWIRLFGFKGDFTALNHIPVHAMHDQIYKNVFKDLSRKKREITMLKKYNSTSYLAAWDYVETKGSKKIVDQLKDSYSSMAEKYA